MAAVLVFVWYCVVVNGTEVCVLNNFVMVGSYWALYTASREDFLVMVVVGIYIAIGEDVSGVAVQIVVEGTVL